MARHAARVAQLHQINDLREGGGEAAGAVAVGLGTEVARGRVGFLGAVAVGPVGVLNITIGQVSVILVASDINIASHRQISIN